ncbi:hypothetical protein NMG29_01090 [Streptomyces cocklensis]|uniref:Uncharacterized protein n=1 Tax=Actinacidiphila cocklensis TaxID=887465 RepID=A0A9W4DWY4_9ACTN|nr:hypothetical protein [Actinacidiphila cocklensis]MDD1056843.1 hypothetical protein [Actinacidiphila cocklensis]CAG6397670.1 conserved hypothetical protein [Actinacidiphila cocklensis]
MTRFGTRRLPVADPMDPVEDVDPEAGHRRALVLSEVAAEGPIGLFRVLRRAASGDTDAAGIRVSGLVRALPGVTMLDSHDFLLRAHIRDSDLAGDLTPGQRVALVSVVDRTQHFDEPRA